MSPTGMSQNGDASSSYSSEERSMSGTGVGLFRKATNSGMKSKPIKNMGDRDDDIHVCVSCLRAIMNNKVGSSDVSENHCRRYEGGSSVSQLS